MQSDNLEVTVAIPTYRTTKKIFKLLDSLKAQTYENFTILLVYKSWPGSVRMLNKIEEYTNLNIEKVRQINGMFEEALNIIYKKADGDVVIHTDDDAYVSKNWVKDNIEMHKTHKEVGIATGLVNENILEDGSKPSFLKEMLNKTKWRMNKHTIIDKPIEQKYNGYGMYIGKSGMLVDTGKSYNMIKTFKQHGVNMSWKKDALQGFKLPGFTIRGGGNEAAAALEVIQRGYEAVWFNKGLVFHPIHASLSRGKSISMLPVELTAERVLFAYYTQMFGGFTIDLKTLALRNKIDRLIASAISPSAEKGYKIGYELTRSAIMENWPPHKVRKELIKRVSKEST